MTLHYAREATRGTPQSHQAHPQQVANSAGGYSFPLDDWGRLDRFLILGTEGGTYYIGQRELTRENTDTLRRLLDVDGRRVIARTVEVSAQGLAHKNDPALFVLALASINSNPVVRKAAFSALHNIARIGTHLYTFIDYRQTLGGGWGRGMREAVSAWYTRKPDDKLAYQLIKYRQRGGWSHRDVLRKAHPQAPYGAKNAMFAWVTQGEFGPALQGTLIDAFEAAQAETDKGKLIKLIVDNRLPREAIPTEWLTDTKVLEALLQDMPMTAMIRNLVNLTKHGVLTNGNANTRLVIQRLRDEERIQRARIHPLSVLMAMKVYERGSPRRGESTYMRYDRPQMTHTPVTPILDALEDAFYLAFKNVEPTGARMLLGLDVSGSMAWTIPSTAISCAEGTAAMAMVTARAETFYDIRGFSTQFIDLGITKKDRLDSALQKVRSRNFGGTDCALPMNWARENKREYDAFVVYTDSETWAGYGNHPFEALESYRQAMGIPAKMVVVGMTSSGFSIADPNDAGSLDIVGFDASAPAVISNFIRG
jgi:60 kDa SS-A/Ro ribonucleoprotein